MVDEGYLPLLAADLGGLEGYWKQLLLDFPTHPAHGQEARCLPLTLYGPLFGEWNHIVCFAPMELICIVGSM
jgi:hypothetical protein